MYFRNEYAFLSNLYPAPITIPIRLHPDKPTEYLQFSCVEAAFQGLKDFSRIREFTKLNGAEAKKLGRNVHLRPDWQEVKVWYMERLIHIKFAQHPELQEKLLDIPKNVPIVEHNTWSDTFWGVCNNTGENHLGRILTEKRDKLLKERENQK